MLCCNYRPGPGVVADALLESWSASYPSATAAATRTSVPRQTCGDISVCSNMTALTTAR